MSYKIWTINGVNFMAHEIDGDETEMIGKHTFEYIEQLERDLAAAREWIAGQPCKHKVRVRYGFKWSDPARYKDCGSCMSCVERKRKADRNLQSEMACRKNALESVKEKISGIKWESIYQGKFVDDEESKDGND